MNTTPRRSWLALSILPVLALGACGDDEKEATATTPAAPAVTTAAPDTSASAEGDLDTFCASHVAMAKATAVPPLEEGDVEGAKAFAASLLPIGEQMRDSAPASVKADLEMMVGILSAAAESGDTSAMETDEFGAADGKVHGVALEGCGWDVQNVELEDYHFMGVPDTLPAGVTSFELTNGGKEMHELVVLRKNDGVSESFDEILGLPMPEMLSKVTPLAFGFTPPGVPGYAVADLTVPGDYLAVCFLPVGFLPDGPPPEDAPPHLTQGMTHEFIVA